MPKNAAPASARPLDFVDPVAGNSARTTILGLGSVSSGVVVAGVVGVGAVGVGVTGWGVVGTGAAGGVVGSGVSGFGCGGSGVQSAAKLRAETNILGRSSPRRLAEK